MDGWIGWDFEGNSRKQDDIKLFEFSSCYKSIPIFCFVFVFEMRKTAGRAGVGGCVFGFGHVSGRGRAHWTSK